MKHQQKALGFLLTKTILMCQSKVLGKVEDSFMSCDNAEKERTLRAPSRGSLGSLRCSPACPVSGGHQSPQAALPASFIYSDHKPQGFATNCIPTMSTGVTFEAW